MESGCTWHTTLSIWLCAGRRALDPQEVVATGVVVVMMASAVVAEGGSLLHQHLPEWALLTPGVTGDGAQVVASTQGPHPHPQLGWFGPPYIIVPNTPSPAVLHQSVCCQPSCHDGGGNW